MKIAIIGAGNVGATLGRRFAQHGHEIVYGVREPGSDRSRRATDSTPGSASVSLEEIPSDANLLILAVPGDAVEETLSQLGDLDGRVLVDATNPIGVDTRSSGAEKVAELAPGARVVKAFNNVGFEVMAHPAFGNAKALTFICGDDREARDIVFGLAAEIGFQPLELGGLENAHLAEAAASIWIELALRQGLGRGWALGLLRR